MGKRTPILSGCIIWLFAWLVLPVQMAGQFILNGSAGWIDHNCVRIVPNDFNKAGSVWYEKKVDLQEDFDLQLRLYFGCRDAGADGIVFVLQPLNTSIGSIGGGIGFSGVQPSLGVEFDTYTNGHLGDPPYDHIAIEKNGNLNHNNTATVLAAPVPAINPFTNIEDCREHLVRITWDAQSHTMQVYFDCELKSTYTGDIVAEIFNNDPEVYWGFTSGTGSERNEHRVCLLYNPYVSNQQDTTVCQGGSIQLRAVGGTSYRWKPDSTLSDTTVANPVATPVNVYTVYHVRVIDSCGNSWLDSVEVQQVTIEPQLPDVISMCEGSEKIIDATTPGALRYLWQDGGTGATFTVKDSGTYWVDVISGGCVVRDSVKVLFAPRVVPELGPDASMCPGDTLLLDAGEGYTDYRWNTGSTERYLPVWASGQYSVEVTDSCGKLFSDNIFVEVVEKTPIDLGNDTSICPGTSLVLDATASGAAAYLWQDGSTQPKFTATGPGTYYVAVTIKGCENYDTLVIRDEGLQVDLGPDRYACEGEPVRLSTGNKYGVYFWPGNITDSIFYVSTPGKYWVQVITDTCTAYDTVEVFIYPTPILNGRKTDSVCLFEPYTLDAGEGYAKYEWYDGDSSRYKIVEGPGYYRVSLTDMNGCRGTDSFQLIPRDLPPIYIPNVFSPNTDGINENFHIYGLEKVQKFDLQIYNRWGERVFESRELAKEWDGSFNSQKVIEGLYIYLLNVQDCNYQWHFFKGSIVVLR